MARHPRTELAAVVVVPVANLETAETASPGQTEDRTVEVVVELSITLIYLPEGAHSESPLLIATALLM